MNQKFKINTTLFDQLRMASIEHGISFKVS
jgi:hypothetical protein